MYKLLGVTGPTGSGKSSFVSFLSKKTLNTKVISGDKYMKQAFIQYRDVLKQVIGPLEQWPDGRPKTRNFNITAERFSETLKIITPYVNDNMLQAINSVPETTELIIADWSHLPLLSIWENTNPKVVISADDNIRLQRLISRDDPSGSSIGRIKARMKSTWLPYTELAGIVVSNNASKEELHRKAGDIKRSLGL